MGIESRQFQLVLAACITAAVLVLAGHVTHLVLVTALPEKELLSFFSESYLAVLASFGVEGRSILITILGLCAFDTAFTLAGILVIYKAHDSPPAMQFGWLLLIAASFIAHTLVLPALPSTSALTTAFPLTNLISRLVLVALFPICLARFFVVFPRSVDTDSVHATFLKWRFMRWLIRDEGTLSVALRSWHKDLLSGNALVIYPLALVGLVLAIFMCLLILPLAVVMTAIFLVILLVFFFYVVLALPYAVATTFHLYYYGTLDERRRVATLRSIVIGLFVALAVLTAVDITLWVFHEFIPDYIAARLNNVGALFALMLPFVTIVAIGMTVVFERTLDPRLVFRRFTLFTLLGGGLTFAFVFMERLLTIQVVQWFQLTPDSGALIAGGLVASTFVPIRNVIQAGIDRMAERWIPVHLLADGARTVQIVAIIDLSGYTALSARDEPEALLQSAVLKRVAVRVSSQYNGRLVKTMGDAVMLVFNDTSGALASVREIHAEFPLALHAVSDLPLPLHSAIHRGEVVTMNDGDIFGQTVNVTARLVDAATGGQIVVSGDVAAMLPDTRFESKGERSFKNVPAPVQCLVVL